ncbi:helix-turn-helix transcriptional regulator [Marinibactrum halimedae]|uniref:HTH cro/C1-type domain-containing protein n=1 Tax=Marinibactrum halimedae TaxID=1444977 RepID=A0AA37WN54_9GAMM|nr:helix-turn-helix transcriptional regulator [Marinibactrum halimedae]GLS24652.1 hypothetical protein GCM10007877_03660 [Marinibactrum halimedae]
MGISQEKLAFRASLSVTSIREVELDKKQLTVFSLFKVAKALQLNPDELLRSPWLSWSQKEGEY